MTKNFHQRINYEKLLLNLSKETKVSINKISEISDRVLLSRINKALKQLNAILFTKEELKMKLVK